MTEMQLRKKELEEKTRAAKEKEKNERSSIREAGEERKRKQSRDKWERNQGFAKTVGGLVKDAASSFSSIGFNDPEWYKKIHGLVENVGKLPFNTQVGLPIPGVLGPEYQKSNNLEKEAIPGFMRLGYVPTYGPLDGSTVNAVNRAALKAYTYMRSKNASVSNFQPNDLMQFFIAMDNICMMLNKINRVYRLAFSYNKWNRLLPTYILQSMGYNVQDIVNNLANYRYRLNKIIDTVRQFAMPAGYTIFDRHRWLTSFIFKDSEADTAQMYYFDPAATYIYDWNNQRLNAQNLNSIINTTGNVGSLSNELNLLEAMVNALWHYSDIGEINANILKAYGESGLIQWDLIPEDADSTSLFVYHKEVLRQIHNADLNLFTSPTGPGGFPAASGTNTWNIIQTGDFLAYSPATTYSSGAIAAHINAHPASNLPTAAFECPVLDGFELKDPSEDDVMVMSRLKRLGVVTANSSGVVTDTHGYFASEIIVQTMLYNVYDNAGTMILASAQIAKFLRINGLESLQSGPANLDLSRAVSWLAKFDWAPQVYIYCLDGSNYTDVTFIADLFDVDNLTPISQVNLIRLNDVAMLSLFHSPVDQY